MREAISDRLEQEFLEKGMEKGLEIGERNMISLVKILMAGNRLGDLKRAAEDEEYRKNLCRELRITDKDRWRYLK